MRNVKVLLDRDFAIGETDRAPVRRLRRASRPLRLWRHLRARPPDRRREGLPRRRAGAGARAGADDHALSRRQLRLRLQLGGRRRPGREAPAPARPRLALDRAQHLRHQRVRRLVPARRHRADAGRQPRHARAGRRARDWSSTATIPPARSSPTCAASTAGSSRTASSSGASATRWTAPGRWSSKTRDEYGRVATEAAKMMRLDRSDHRARRLRLVRPQHADLRRVGAGRARAHLRPCRVHLAAHLSQRLCRRHAGLPRQPRPDGHASSRRWWRSPTRSRPGGARPSASC